MNLLIKTLVFTSDTKTDGAATRLHCRDSEEDAPACFCCKVKTCLRQAMSHIVILCCIFVTRNKVDISRTVFDVFRTLLTLIVMLFS